MNLISETLILFSEQIEAWRQAGFMTPLGHVDDMDELLKSIDIMVLPSFYREGVLRSLMELPLLVCLS